MIVDAIFYGIKCDRCGSIHEGGEGYTYMMDKSSILEDALENEWVENNGKHYCPNCYIPSEDEDSEEITIKPAIPDLVKKIEKFLKFITKNTPRTIETSDSFEMSFNEYKPIGNAELNWLTSFPNVSFERITNTHYNKITITIKS